MGILGFCVESALLAQRLSCQRQLSVCTNDREQAGPAPDHVTAVIDTHMIRQTKNPYFFVCFFATFARNWV